MQSHLSLKSIRILIAAFTILFVTINPIFLFIIETQTESLVYASVTQISDSEEWSEIQQLPILSEYDQYNYLLFEHDGFLTLLWRERSRSSSSTTYLISYNGISWKDKQQLDVNYPLLPIVIEYRGNLYSAYMDQNQVFFQSVDNSIKSPAQNLSEDIRSYSIVNYQDKLFLFYSVEKDGFGSSQIWLITYDGNSLTTPQQITTPPRFNYLVQAAVADDKIFLVYASGPSLEEIEEQHGGWNPSVYFTFFDGQTWSQPEKACDGAPESLTSYGKGLYLVYSSIESMKPRLRTFYNGVWSDEELLPIPNTLIPEHGREEIGSINAYMYQGRLMLVWSRYLVNSESAEGKYSIWFITYPDQPSEFASDEVKVTDGFVEIDQSSLTGVSVNISGLAQNGETIKVDTVDYGNVQPLGTGTFEGEVIAFYDIKISPTKSLENNAEAQISITNQKFSSSKDCVISFWNGNSWQSIETSYISLDTISGILLASDLMSTSIMVGNQAQNYQSFLTDQQIILIIAVTVILSCIIVITVKARKGKGKNKTIQ